MRGRIAGLTLMAAALAAACEGSGPAPIVQSTAPASADASRASGATAPDPAMARAAGYDETRDPSKDLAALIPVARASHKRILLEVGGEWCVWCHYLHDFLERETAIAALWDERFVTLKVNYSEANPNTAFLSRYPKVPGYPHLFVLDEDGTFLHSQGTEVLESGRGYSADAVRRFLNEWGPRHPATTTRRVPAT